MMSWRERKARLFGDDMVEYTIPLRKQTTVNMHAALQKSYTEFLNKWESRTFSRSSTTVDDFNYKYSSVSHGGKKFTGSSTFDLRSRGMTDFFRQQLLASIDKEDKHMDLAIRLVDEPAPLDTVLEGEFTSLLIESDAAEWQSCLAHSRRNR